MSLSLDVRKEFSASHVLKIRARTLPFIPSEKEIDAVIARMNYCIAALLQLLKETVMRPGEAWNLRWIDLDARARKIIV